MDFLFPLHLVILVVFYIVPSSGNIVLCLILSDFLCFLWSTGCRTVVLLLMSAPGGWGWSKRFWAGFLVGGLDPCPLMVELGLVSLVDKAMSRDMLRRSCGSKVILIDLVILRTACLESNHLWGYSFQLLTVVTVSILMIQLCVYHHDRGRCHVGYQKEWFKSFPPGK